MKNNAKILITGANGFLASTFINYIKDKFNIKADVIIRKNNILKDSIKDSVANIYFWNGNKLDIPNNYFNDLDYVFHFATNFCRENDIEASTKMADDNILFGTYLLSLLNGKTTFVNIASWTSYNEYGEYAPHNFYSLTKGLFEKIALSTYKNTISIRMPDTYGPNDERDKIYNLIRKGIVTNLNSLANQEINMIHTEDVCGSLIYIINKKFNQNIFDLYYKENIITLEELANYLGKNVTFGDKEVIPLVKNNYPVQGYKTIKNLKDIGDI